jgi:hypothetical protein
MTSVGRCGASSMSISKDSEKSRPDRFAALVAAFRDFQS